MHHADPPPSFPCRSLRLLKDPTPFPLMGPLVGRLEAKIEVDQFRRRHWNQRLAGLAEAWKLNDRW